MMNDDPEKKGRHGYSWAVKSLLGLREEAYGKDTLGSESWKKVRHGEVIHEWIHKGGLMTSWLELSRKA